MLGAPVDALEPLHQELTPFVVAQVLEVGPHPDPKATKVRLTTVDDGTGAPLTVVCGAPNVTAGKRYPFARLGTRMPGPKGFIIEAPESCPRFHAAVIRGAIVGPSPDWLRRRLEAVGLRSINNVVDATNYVMLELNQPMHACDLAKLRGGMLVVRRARAGERL